MYNWLKWVWTVRITDTANDLTKSSTFLAYIEDVVMGFQVFFFVAVTWKTATPSRPRRATTWWRQLRTSPGLRATWPMSNSHTAPRKRSPPSTEPPLTYSLTCRYTRIPFEIGPTQLNRIPNGSIFLGCKDNKILCHTSNLLYCRPILQTPERHDHAYQCYNVTEKRCGALLHWITQVCSHHEYLIIELLTSKMCEMFILGFEDHHPKRLDWHQPEGKRSLQGTQGRKGETDQGEG